MKGLTGQSEPRILATNQESGGAEPLTARPLVETPMRKGQVKSKAKSKVKGKVKDKMPRAAGPAKGRMTEVEVQGILWRLDRLERQVRTLSELVRDHAEDADRLVRIVGEDHELLRHQLLREHQEALRDRKRAQAAVSLAAAAKFGLTP